MISPTAPTTVCHRLWSLPRTVRPAGTAPLEGPGGGCWWEWSLVTVAAFAEAVAPTGHRTTHSAPPVRDRVRTTSTGQGE